MQSKTNESKAMIFGLIAVLCWSTVATAFKIALSFQSVSTLVFTACVTTVLLLGSLLAWQGRLKTALVSITSAWKPALLFGLLNPILYYHILLSAYAILPAQVAQPINYTWAIMLALLSVPFLGHKLTKFDLCALVICYSGVVVISLGASPAYGGPAYGGPAEGDQSASSKGVILALISTVIWAAYWILNSRDQREPVLALFQNFLLATPFALALAWPLDLNWQGVAASAYIGIFEMGISFVCWLFAMKLTQNASRISNLIFLAPFISLVLIYFVLGETIHHFTIYGLLLIVSGLLIQNKFAKQP